MTRETKMTNIRENLEDIVGNVSKAYHALEQGSSRLYDVARLLYMDTLYTAGFSAVAGMGNGLAAAQAGDRFAHGFAKGFVNNAPLGMAVNPVYPLLVDYFVRKTSGKPRIITHVLASSVAVVVNVGFGFYHAFLGTDNPVETGLANILAGMVMTNIQVYRMQKKTKKS